MKSRFLTLAAAAMMFAVPSIAAAQNAVATANVNMRVGPGTQHPVIGSLPAGAPVTVRGCVRGYAWCDTQYGGMRGWVSGSFLAGHSGQYRGRSFVEIAPALGIGIIAGAILGNIGNDRYDRHDARESRGYWNRHSDRESRGYWGGRHSDRESRRWSHSSRESRARFSDHSTRDSRRAMERRDDRPRRW